MLTRKRHKLCFGYFGWKIQQRIDIWTHSNIKEKQIEIRGNLELFQQLIEVSSRPITEFILQFLKKVALEKEAISCYKLKQDSNHNSTSQTNSFLSIIANKKEHAE